MKQVILMVTFCCALFSAQFVSAQARTPRITHRQHTQQQRIRQGVRSGEITKGEARHLQYRQRKLQHDKHLAKADGVVTANERRHLMREENANNRAIYRAKHNNI